MILDELIEALQEAKEHYVQGKSKVFITKGINGHNIGEIIDVTYNNDNVFLAYD